MELDIRLNLGEVFEIDYKYICFPVRYSLLHIQIAGTQDLLILVPNYGRRKLPHDRVLVVGRLLLLDCDLTYIVFSPLSLKSDKMVAQEFTVDLNKPLVFQVGHLGEAYQEWVHQPIVSKEGPRFFESDFWEFLTRTVWWAIPTIWLPVVCYCISMSIQMGHTLPQVALLVVAGIFVWTLVEYTLHRFLFHIKTKTYWGNTMHYLIHGCHHKHPMDGLRLVFPPAATAILCVPFWNFVKLISTPTTTPALFGGGLLGYVMYDCTHYYLHHGQPSSDVPRNLKKYHLNHHFRVQTKGFGITSALWDKVFGTLPSSKTAEKSR